MKLPPLDGSSKTDAKADQASSPKPGADPLGDKPSLDAPRSFEPPVPVQFKTSTGLDVWLVSNPSLPLVSMTLVVSRGAAADPAGKSGLAYVTSDMMDEGAGERSAVELSTAINDLGASLRVGAGADGAYASLTTLRKNFDDAFAIFADVVARPRFEQKEWDRVAELWINQLEKRADDPSRVSSLASYLAAFGAEHAYGRPTSGLIRDAKTVSLDDVRAFYAATWQPQQATLVVSGDITRADVEKAVEKSLGDWKATAKPLSADVKTDVAHKPPRLILVDRAEAPQSVIAVVRRAVDTLDERTPYLELINTALGGSFTSRLNQNLREEKNWTYGVRSGFTELREDGALIIRTAIELPHTGEAVKEIIDELNAIASEGISEEELAKVKAQDRTELVETYGTVSGVAGRLGSLARLGLPPSFDADSSAVRQKATLAQLKPLSREFFNADDCTFIIVGPRKAVEPQLEGLELGTPTIWTTEGEVEK